ncbi:DUF4396 domain-containing protein [Sphingomonas sp. ac-8]|uniref:DUF4396 domain-containing protein n=1 Tax=Sphingomonas sp. ac-8 TaxID=3242977 RepID=UPI003A80F2C5
MHDGDFPSWLHLLATGSLLIAGCCAVAIAIDQRRHPPKMTIMALVWPLTALFGSLLWLAAYRRWGRGGGEKQGDPPFAAMVLKGASHCGAGCTLGDIVVEWATFAMPAIAVWFGWGSLFAEKTFAVWIPDFLVAFLFGIVFQYFTIRPMRDLSVGQGIVAAVKADIASIAAWQIGMYGGMALIQFVWFRAAYGGIAPVASPEFWFAMQIAMLGGFATSYPVNWWLIRAGLKERM